MAKQTMLSAEPPDWSPGSVVAGYRLESRIGAGGMAVVFRARDEALNRLVALKILAGALADDPTFRERFIRESRTVAGVDHPHIIPVYAAGEFGDALYLAMRFVSGGDLMALLVKEGPLPRERAASLLSPIASALDAAHASGLVHRDVKPGNILIDVRPGRTEHPYLTDFGLAKTLVLSSATNLTAAGQFLGTPDYAAPEQITEREVNARTDQYALACVTYTMLTGQPPFHRSLPVAAMYAHVSAPPPSMTDRRPDLSPSVDQVLARALAKEPADRFPTCGDFAEALREALGLPAAPTLAGVSLPPLPVPDDTGAMARPAESAPKTVAGIETVAGVIIDPDAINGRAELFAALDAVRQHADLSARDVATMTGLPTGTVRNYFRRKHLPAEREVLRQILAACGIPAAALPHWDGALIRAKAQRQQGTATGKTRARVAGRADNEAFYPPGGHSGQDNGDESDLLFRIYIPKTQLYAEQRREMLRLFREWLTGVQGQNVRHLEESTTNGDTVTFFAMPGQPHPPLIEEYREFASFVEHCARSPATAVSRLADTKIGEAASAALVTKYSKEYYRLELDLRQARETRILELQHSLEAELLESDADPQGILGLQIRSALEKIVPPPTSAALSAVTASDVHREQTQINMTFNAEHIVYTAVESIQGTANFGPQAKELMALINRYGAQDAGSLRTALHELEDPGVSRELKSGAKKKLKSFLANLARTLPDVGTDLLEKYLERKLGLG